MRYWIVFWITGGLLLLRQEGLLIEASLSSSSSTSTTTTTKAASAAIVVSVSDFSSWKLFHRKQYDSALVDRRRAMIFATNAKLVAAHNVAYDQGYTFYTMTITSPFADVTGEEFAKMYLMTAPQNCSATTHPSSGTLRPVEQKRTNDHSKQQKKKMHRDWRTQGIITPIENQKSCGSCWTFSTTGCLEAHMCLQDENLDCTEWSGLAEQQLVDCAQNFNNFGCNGGLPSQAFEYIKYNGGIDLETSYEYVANQTDGICKSKLGTIGGYVAEVFNITSYDEEDLEYAVAEIGPVSIAYQVAHDFRLYEHGVYDSYNVTTNTTMCGNTPHEVNHAVVAVGLDETETGVPFYIVRNSWGTQWGMEGYFWIKRGVNLCGLSDCASFPLVPYNTDPWVDNHNNNMTDSETTTLMALLRQRKLRS